MTVRRFPRSAPRTPRRPHAAALVALLAALLLGAGWAQQAPQRLTLAMSAQPETLDPQVTAATSSFQVTKSLYDTLVEPGRDGRLVPALAEGWTVSDDGLTWTFELAEAAFHDGSAFDAADVKASLERIAAEATASPKAGEFETIETVLTPDPRTVVLVLSEPNPALLASLASGWGAMLPSEKIAAGHDFGNDPVGTGPFQLRDWVRDSHLQLDRFDDHFRGAPALAEVTVRFVPDSAVQLQGLLAGEFDVIDTVATADYDTVRARDDLELVQEPSGLVLVAALNTRRPFLDDPRVRRALNLAVDKQTVLDVAYGGGQPVGTFMEAGSPWYPEAGAEPFPFDPEEAQRLLAEAGVPTDWRLDLVLPQPYETHIQAGQIVQDMLRSVGVQSDIRIAEWGVWLDEVYRGERDFDVTTIGHTGKLDPTGRLGGYGDEAGNYVGYDDPEVAVWLAEAASESDPEARRALYQQVLQRMHRDAPFIYFGTPFTTYARRAGVEGFWITPLLDTFDFRDVQLR